MSQLTDMPDFLMITGNEGEEKPSETVIREFEKAIADTNSGRVINADAYFVSRFFFRLWKPESVFRLSRLPFKILNQLVYRNPKNYFVVLIFIPPSVPCLVMMTRMIGFPPDAGTGGERVMATSLEPEQPRAGSSADEDSCPIPPR